MMKTSSRWAIAFLVCLTIFIALAAFKFFQIQAAIAFGKSFPEPSETVEAVTAMVSDYHTSVTTIGEVVAPQSVDLRNELEGRIAAVNFVSGDTVKKGDVLLQLDISEETARLKAAQARVNLAELDLQRVKRLIKQKTVSEERLDQADADFQIAQADALALQATIDKKTLQAPFDAIAGLHQLEVGEFLESNTHIVTLVGLNDYVWVDFNLPVTHAVLSVGAEVTVLPSQSLPEPLTATVIARDSLASASSRNLRFRARVDSGGALPPNAVVRVAVPVGTEREVVIPTVALQKDGMGDFVYVLINDEEGKGYRAQRRAIKIGDMNDKTTSILEGLSEGEIIAAQGGFKLRQNVLTIVAKLDGLDTTSPAANPATPEEPAESGAPEQ